MGTDPFFVLSQCTRLTDGRTEGQTDSFRIAVPRLHSMQRGKNWHVDGGDVLIQH